MPTSDTLTIKELKDIVTLDVFREIMFYAHLRRDTNSKISTLYGKSFRCLESKKEICDLCYRSELEGETKENDVAIALFLLFVYSCGLCPNGVMECIQRNEKKIADIARQRMKMYNFELEKNCFQTLVENFRMQWKVNNEPTGTKPVGELSEDAVELLDILSGAIKNYEGAIKTQLEKYNAVKAEIESLRTENAMLRKEVEAAKVENWQLRDSMATKGRMQRYNITEAFCEISIRYMNANKNKSQSAREKKKETLVDIMSQLKLKLPEDIQRHLNNFDDEEHPKTIINNFGASTQIVHPEKIDIGSYSFYQGSQNVGTITNQTNVDKNGRR